ncbi:protein PHLOEM PROTEIN 2-LIKE A9-like [Abrus precatorius]|uniref:Protein PHLOEM PROTEIN 2-LIKE A9-like n=1 Tax=Abrus precatorius TaxID=3816 RepID=A0A8B8JS37_ABRPR|nr:protein PHLOEM PROTEIN 2-LIKE A9-like [Abrus precatorius]
MPFKKPHHTSDPNYIVQVDDRGYIIQPRGLNIVWGNDSRYWRIPDQGAAELIQVSWLEVSGKVAISKEGNYSIKFSVNVKADGFGWDGTEVLVMAKVGKTGRYTYQVAKLTPGRRLTIPIQQLKIPVSASDAAPKDLYFGLYEVWSGKWKGGLEIESAEVLRES